MYRWRSFLLRLFGAKIEHGARIYSSVKVYFPSNFIVGSHSIVGPHVEVYCVSLIEIGANCLISQYAYLCSATHDYSQSTLPLVTKDIAIQDRAWICAKAFIGPGVTVGENSIVGACAVVVRDVPRDAIVGGNPAKFIKTKPSVS
jgi:putative colanic acid biosynthesis acetyltransferase WcaF